MITKKLFIITIIFSLVGHIAVLGLTGMLDIGRSVDNDTIFTVHLERMTEKTGSPPASPPEETFDTRKTKDEDTVDLDSLDSPYHQYLIKVKKKIRNRWSYPARAYKLKEEGTAVVRFSIQGDGKLADSRIIIPSGHVSLDSESFNAIKSSSPFEPLPQKFKLTQLHIVARFQYLLDG